MDQQQILEKFSSIVGARNLETKEAELASLGTDWSKHPATARLAVFPGSTTEVSEIMKQCSALNVPVVPSGGRTGLAGGACASNGEVVLSLNRMQKISAIDEVGMTVNVEAGVTTEVLQNAAREVGLFFGLDLAAKGSSQIGGNIATNAGGTKFIRYGGAREQVLGLEVVLADGTILDLNQSTRKDNTGYDLKHLFIGSEGTLGIITKATLKLMPKPRDLQLCCFATDEFAKIGEILRICQQKSIPLTAFEFFTNKAHEIVLHHHPSLRSPFQDRHRFYTLIEFEKTIQDSLFEEVVELVFEKGYAADAVLAGSSTEFHELWAHRERITESLASNGHVWKNDISVGVGEMAAFLAKLEKTVNFKAHSNVQTILFGHIGDGNLHLNYIGEKSIDFQTFKESVRRIEKQVFELVRLFRGSISAEHGIGLLKKSDLAYSNSDLQINIMRDLKALFDPKNILNPGKIFDPK